LARASYYYQPAGESDLNLRLMRLIDAQYLRTPFYGWPKMTACLQRQGFAINHKRVQRLMQLMGLQAIYPKPKTSVPGQGHKIYPYLLRGLEITQPNQVWSADITYVPLPHGFMYLVAVIDWFSRYVLAWQLSNTLDGLFCREVLTQSLCLGRPEIFNTDQGAQFTAQAFTDCLEAAGIRISMDGRGRALDNIFVERLMSCAAGLCPAHRVCDAAQDARSLKYENIYIREYASVAELIAGLCAYFQFYNTERPHQSLDYRTPAEVHFA
jgi:putative transposase